MSEHRFSFSIMVRVAGSPVWVCKGSTDSRSMAERFARNAFDMRSEALAWSVTDHRTGRDVAQGNVGPSVFCI